MPASPTDEFAKPCRVWRGKRCGKRCGKRRGATSITAKFRSKRETTMLARAPSLVTPPTPRARSYSAGMQSNGPFGPDSFVRYEPSFYRIVVQAHGAPGNTGHKSAAAVAKVIDNFMLERRIQKSNVKYLYLQSCWARSGGLFSQAAALANITGFKVLSVKGRYSEQRRNEMKVTEPNRFEFVRALSKTGNKVMFGVTEAGLSLVARTSGAAGGASAAAHGRAQSS